MTRHPRDNPMRRAFTLIELLVVITIIVVLLAMLAPALEKAIYQAELVRCAANQHGLGTGVVAYAMDQRRRYPYRAGVHEQHKEPMNLSLGQPENPRYDDRTILKPYISLNKTLNCPLLPAMDIEGSHADTKVFGAYSLWFGFQFLRETPPNQTVYPGMLRMGDRWEWFDESVHEGPVRSGLLASTRYVRSMSFSALQASHPGYDTSWYSATGQDKPVGTQGVDGFKETTSRWYSDGATDPRFMDLNALYDDLSVIRSTGVDYDHDRDGRTAPVPAYSDSGSWYTQWHELIPKR